MSQSGRRPHPATVTRQRTAQLTPLIGPPAHPAKAGPTRSVQPATAGLRKPHVATTSAGTGNGPSGATKLVQPARRARQNVVTYNSTTGYSQADVDRAVDQTGGVAGHGSKRKNRGAHQNANTAKTSAVLFDQLRANKASDKEEKKAAHLAAREEKRGGPSDFKVAKAKAEALIADKGREFALGDFAQFLSDHGYDDSLEEEQLNRLYALFS